MNRACLLPAMKVLSMGMSVFVHEMNRQHLSQLKGVSVFFLVCYSYLHLRQKTVLRYPGMRL
jgi:hypothetical protein